MGHRDYLGDSQAAPRFALPRMQPVVKALIWINVGVWILTYLLKPSVGIAGSVYEALTLAPKLWSDWFPFVPLWQLVTYGFLHSLGDAWHVVFNMLGLYFFGTWLEGIVGSRRLLFLYLASIALGGVFQLGGAFAFDDLTPTVGASGAVMFLIIAVAVLQPSAQVIFFIFPMKMRTLALIYVGINVYGLIEQIRGGGNNTAVIVHLAGAGYGFAAAKLGWIWFDPFQAWERARAARAVAEVESDEHRLDTLLQQIHDRGIGSLSRSERAFLKRMSSRKSD